MPRLSILSDALAMRRVMRDYRRSRSELAPVVAERMRKVLESAYLTVPYYRQVMTEAGYDPRRDFQGPSDLQRLPILDKQLIRRVGARAFVQEGADLASAFEDHSSGSTGVPLQIWRSPLARSLQMARWMRVLRVNGYQLTDKVLSFTSPARLGAGRSALQRVGLLRRRPVNFSLTPSQLLDAVLEYGPDVIYGNRSKLDLVAMEALKRGCRVPPVKFVAVGAEVIRDANRRLYESAFHCRVVESYGSVELGIIAFETPRYRHMQLCEDQLYFEFVNAQGKPAQVGELCRIVVTDLANTLMPFIRYDQGDWLELCPQTTDDDRDWRMIRKIQGRDDDLATLPDGSKVAFQTFQQVVDRFEHVHQFRIVQVEPHLFRVVLAADHAYVESIRNDMLAGFRERFDGNLVFQIEQVDRIDPDPTGKLRRLVAAVSPS